MQYFEQIESIFELSKRLNADLQHYYYVGALGANREIFSLKAYERNALFFLGLKTPTDLSRFLNISMLDLGNLVNMPKYKTYSIRKKRGGVRFISAPGPQLKYVQKRLNYYLQAYYFWIKPEASHGFVINPRSIAKKHTIVTNAEAHMDKKHLINLDLKDFFSSISASQLKKLFMSFHFRFDEQMASILALLMSYMGHLPTGAPSSPVLSNFICLELDRELTSFCNDREITYTRYADDLSFSSNYFIPHDAILDIMLLIKNHGFRLNHKKFRIRTSSKKQTVTGILVNEFPNVDRKLLKRIRAIVHDIHMNGLEHAAQRHFNLESVTEQEIKLFIQRTRGYIMFVRQVRGEHDWIYQNLFRDFKRAIFFKTPARKI